MKTLIVVPKALRVGQAHYIVPAKASTGGLTPSLRLQVGKENEVPVADQAHEELLRADRCLKVVGEKGRHDQAPVDPVGAALAKVPAELRKEIGRALEKAVGEQFRAAEEDLADTKAELAAIAAKQGALEKENAELRAGLDQANKEKAELEAKLVAATKPASDAKPTPPVDEKKPEPPKPEKPKGK